MARQKTRRTTIRLNQAFFEALENEAYEKRRTKTSIFEEMAMNRYGLTEEDRIYEGPAGGGSSAGGGPAAAAGGQQTGE